MKIKIQIRYKEGWSTCEHNTWSDVIKAGWVFIELNDHNNVVMTTKGYINEFRNKDLTEL